MNHLLFAGEEFSHSQDKWIQSWRYLYYLTRPNDLTDRQLSVLQRLLRAELFHPKSDPYQPKELFPEKELLMEAPINKFLSPWASRAQDILKNCGLGYDNRIERCVAYRFRVDDKEPGQILTDMFMKYLEIDLLMNEPLVKWPTHKKIFNSSHSDFETESLSLQLQTGLTEEILVAQSEYKSLQSAESGLSDVDRKRLSEHIQRKRKFDLMPVITASELMMYSQVNSEHCRHRIFKSKWRDKKGDLLPNTLFDMIRNTTEKFPQGIVSAYSDNAAVFSAPDTLQQLVIDPASKCYDLHEQETLLVIKVETHNHPTAISPFPGAGTGIGGEIRDEAAVGRGSRTKMGLCGFSVSHLRLPSWQQPWEEYRNSNFKQRFHCPTHIAPPLMIMLNGPLGGAAFANEYGRPTLCGYFRSFEQITDDYNFGYHKPIMIAGGMGTVNPEHVKAAPVPDSSKLRLIVLGGPALPIGLSGGSASSRHGGSEKEQLDYASVQRQNPEMQRCCQEVIDRCCALGKDNPILLIHDVGAGGLANALPELVDDLGLGAKIDLTDVYGSQNSMSQLQLWCNEAQERFVLAVAVKDLQRFKEICAREDCPYAVVGKTKKNRIFEVQDSQWYASQRLGADNADDRRVVDMELNTLLPPDEINYRDLEAEDRKEQANDVKLDFQFLKKHLPAPKGSDSSDAGVLKNAVAHLLHFPAVAAKHFLITINDRSVGGLVCRDQMVGPWQVPVADAAVSCRDFLSFSGEAMAIGERTPIAVTNAAAAARMAVCEALTNIACAGIQSLSDVRLSANWMAEASDSRQSADLYRAVEAVGMDLCPKLGIAIPVGKDSLSMSMQWNEPVLATSKEGAPRNVISPVSLIASAFASVGDVRKALTPQILPKKGAKLFLLDLGFDRNRLGGSCLAQICGHSGEETADVDEPLRFKHAMTVLLDCIDKGLILAMHDRSDGGLFVTLAEMAFAGQLGIEITLSDEVDILPALFSEELGFVLQVEKEHCDRVIKSFEVNELQGCLQEIGQHRDDDELIFWHKKSKVLRGNCHNWQSEWQQLNREMRLLRDNPESAEQEYENIFRQDEMAITAKVTDKAPAAISSVGDKPRIAILRERGVNGQYEMAAAFRAAGFDSFDVHRSDLLSGEQQLKGFQGIAAAGGFSYGDVLGAGRGWGQTILNNPQLRSEFKGFFASEDNIALGICNGCQLFVEIAELIPGSENWPQFLPNESDRYEGRLSMVRIEESPSVLLQGMQGWQLPVPVAHGEGRASFDDDSKQHQLITQNQVVARFCDSDGQTTQDYPANPNGSSHAIAGVCNSDGRVTLMMPHPERAFRNIQYSWCPPECGSRSDFSPWLQLFENARCRILGS